MIRPRVIHTGKLWGVVDCYVLEDKRRVLSMRGAVRALATRSVGADDQQSSASLVRHVDHVFALGGLRPEEMFDVEHVDGELEKVIDANRFIDVVHECAALALNGALTERPDVFIAEACKELLHIARVASLEDIAGHGDVTSACHKRRPSAVDPAIECAVNDTMKRLCGGDFAALFEALWKKPTDPPKEVSVTASFVYFIESSDDGLIKIGQSGDPERRLRSLQTGSWQKLSILGTVPGGRSEERAWHDRFHFARVPGGEWFRPHPKLIDAMREVGVVASRRRVGHTVEVES